MHIDTKVRMDRLRGKRRKQARREAKPDLEVDVVWKSPEEIDFNLAGLRERRCGRALVLEHSPVVPGLFELRTQRREWVSG